MSVAPDSMRQLFIDITAYIHKIAANDHILTVKKFYDNGEFSQMWNFVIKGLNDCIVQQSHINIIGTPFYIYSETIIWLSPTKCPTSLSFFLCAFQPLYS